MKKNLRQLLILLFTAGISVSAAAFTPKLRPGVNEKNGTISGSEDGNEVKLPVGLPFQITDPVTSSSTGSEDGTSNPTNPAKIVYTFDLPDGQGPQTFHETHSAFEQARSLNAACVLIRMNSMTSALNAAENLSNEILDYDRPVMVYVNDKAISASQLISMASDNKKDLNHNKQIKRSVIPTVKGRVGSSSKNEVRDFDNATDESSCTTIPNSVLFKTPYAAAQNSNLDDVLLQAGLNNYQVIHYKPGFFAQVIDWCMKPIASLFFVILIAFGMRLQLKSVFPGPATFLLLISLPLFCIPLFTGGLANAGELAFVILSTFAAVIIGKQSRSNWLQFISTLLLLIFISLCQMENFNLLGHFQNLTMTFLLSGATFATGWYLPTFSEKLARIFRTRISTTA